MMSQIINKHPFLMYITGSCGSGKSNAAKYIIKSLFFEKKIDICFIFSPTAKISSDGSYDFLPSEFIHDKLTETKIKNLMKFQKKSNNKHNMLIIMDDCIGSFPKNSNVLNNFLSTHRHYNISLIFISQYLKGVNPTWRSLFNYVMISKPSNYEDIAKFKSIWFSDISDLPNHFNKLCNGKYKFCYVDLNSDAKQKYKSVKFPKIGKFMINYN